MHTFWSSIETCASTQTENSITIIQWVVLHINSYSIIIATEVASKFNNRWNGQLHIATTGLLACKTKGI